MSLICHMVSYAILAGMTKKTATALQFTDSQHGVPEVKVFLQTNVYFIGRNETACPPPFAMTTVRTSALVTVFSSIR